MFTGNQFPAELHCSKCSVHYLLRYTERLLISNHSVMAVFSVKIYCLYTLRLPSELREDKIVIINSNIIIIKINDLKYPDLLLSQYFIITVKY